MVFELPDLDEETLIELFDTITESLDSIEMSVTNLTANPEDQETLNKLFRELHSVKGNFRVCFMTPFSGYTHSIEEMFSEIRQGRFEFSPAMSEVTLGALDKLRAKMDQIRTTGEIDTDDMEVVSQGFLTIATSEAEDILNATNQLIRLICGAQTEELPVDIALPDIQLPEKQAINTQGLEDDIKYFSTLANLLDGRLPEWGGTNASLIGHCLCCSPLPTLHH
jgi:chemotaxis protein histidine kinase CheA